MYNTIINIDSVRKNLNQPEWVLVDCRYDLSDKDTGKNSYLESHIPGAVYANLHTDLSGPPLTDHGRHPLPSEDHLIKLFERLGISNHSQVIVYDDVYGSFAARLWWLLRYMGHDKVAIVDGGWLFWVQAGFQTNSGEEKNTPGKFQGNARSEWLITVDMVPSARLLVDSRDPARYRGETEPLDRAAGHIPGAINHFWKDNLAQDGRFKDNAILRKKFLSIMHNINPDETVFYCGSGVTACHNLVAAACAGLPSPKLYAGSWSDWCADPDRPVVTGAIPGGNFEA
jgi:thiosulfate/3-mercaptopyruvate sulfurtransferase